MERIVLTIFYRVVMGAAVNCICLDMGTVWWAIGMTVVLVSAFVCAPLCKMISQATQQMMMDLSDALFALLQGSTPQEIMTPMWMVLLLNVLRSSWRMMQTARCGVCSATTVVMHMPLLCPVQPECQLKIIDNLNCGHQFKMSIFKR
jgi:hypothetical protein